MKTKNSILKYIRLGLSARSFPELLHDVREKSSKLSLKDAHSFIVLILESWNATHHSDTEHRMTFQPWLQRHHLEVSNIVLMKINSACIWLKRKSLQTLLTQVPAQHSPAVHATSCLAQTSFQHNTFSMSYSCPLISYLRLTSKDQGPCCVFMVDETQFSCCCYFMNLHAKWACFKEHGDFLSLEVDGEHGVNFLCFSLTVQCKPGTIQEWHWSGLQLSTLYLGGLSTKASSLWLAEAWSHPELSLPQWLFSPTSWCLEGTISPLLRVWQHESICMAIKEITSGEAAHTEWC